MKQPDESSLKARIKAALMRDENDENSSTSKEITPPMVSTDPAQPQIENVIAETPNPQKEKIDANKTIDILKLLHSERVVSPEGLTYWKLVCACGKRIHSPLKSEQPYGRCPKCGGKLPLPGYDSVEKQGTFSEARNVDPTDDAQIFRVSAIHQPQPTELKRIGAPLPIQPIQSQHLAYTPIDEDLLHEPEDPSLAEEVHEHRTTTFAAAVPRKDAAFDQSGANPNLDAAMRAADRLRPSHAGKKKGRGERAVSISASGRISAWPLAGVTRRLLAAFIDLTLAMGIAGTVLLWQLQDSYVTDFDPLMYLLSIMLIVLGFNDALLPLVCPGSIGKMMVLSVVQHTEGGEPSVPQKIMRAVFKWLLIPGWIIGGFDAQQRTLHDLLCSTTVLKSRRKRGTHKGL